VEHLYRKSESYISLNICEQLVKEVFEFKKKYYNKNTLESHIAYLADDRPGRYSHAYALVVDESDKNTKLPWICLSEISKEFPLISLYTKITYPLHCLDPASRILFNVQEYYSNSVAVPRHYDGELLDFHHGITGDLVIQKAIRPELVSVLTLVNDVGEVGTRISNQDFDTMIPCKAGDLLTFDNMSCWHAADAFGANSHRPDGLVRMTIGWRSLADKTYLMEGDKATKISMEEANKITTEWYKSQWPGKWKAIEQSLTKAAF
jgi:hypothetical protein